MNQGLATQSALAGIGNAYAGIDGQTFKPVPAYNLGGALDAGGQAMDKFQSLFINKQATPANVGAYSAQSNPNAPMLSGGYTGPGFPTGWQAFK
jgi:hypothetical protein